MVASILLWLLGGLATLAVVRALLVSLPVELYQWVIDPPLAVTGWHVYPVALAALAAGVAAMRLGCRYDLRF